MATQAVQFSYTVRDALGTEASECYYGEVDPAVALISDIATQWSDLQTLLGAVTAGAIIRGSVSFPMVAAGGAPAADSRVEETAVLNMSSTGSTRRNGFDIPAIKDSVIVAGRVNLLDAGIAALWAALAATGGVVRFTNAYGQPLVTIIDAILSFRKHRGQLQRSSFVVPA